MNAQYNTRSPGMLKLTAFNATFWSINWLSCEKLKINLRPVNFVFIPAVKRLMKEARELANTTDQYFAQPLEVSILKWFLYYLYWVLCIMNTSRNIDVELQGITCRINKGIF